MARQTRSSRQGVGIAEPRVVFAKGVVFAKDRRVMKHDILRQHCCLSDGGPTIRDAYSA